MKNENKFKPTIIKKMEGIKAGIIEFTWFNTPYFEIGWGNGYVCIPEGHPWHGKDYDDIPVEIHGGLTFSEQVNSEYWIGFDSAHPGDNKINRSKKWVEEETLRLMKQAIAAGEK